MATLDTACPICGTPHARKLSLIYEEGRTSTQSTIETVGKTNTIAQVTVTTHGTSFGLQQSDASRAAAPPPIPPLRTAGHMLQPLVIFGSPFAAFFLAMIFDLGFLRGMGFVLGVTFVGFIGGLFIPTKPTEAELALHQARYKDEYAAVERWQQTFSCGSCAHRFIPGEQAQAQTVETMPT